MIKKKKFSVTQFLWDLWCVLSLIGIWPRFIEPKLIKSSKIKITLPNLSDDIANLKIVQFSDLHFNPDVSDRFLNKLTSKILSLKPDLIVFTGDFLCFSNLQEKNRLKKFLNSLQARFGCFAVFGNHDYDQFVSVNDHGEYDVIKPSSSTVVKGFKRLFSKKVLKNSVTKRAIETPIHQELLDLLKETPFNLLHNENALITIGKSKFNICGLGEYSLAKCLPDIAFKNFDPTYKGIVLSHHPDSFSLLKHYPGDLILSGHTHGGQVNLPFFKKKFILLENRDLVRGLIDKENKKIYITRGVGSVMKFRWFSMPEVLLVTFVRPQEVKDKI